MGRAVTVKRYWLLCVQSAGPAGTGSSRGSIDTIKYGIFTTCGETLSKPKSFCNNYNFPDPNQTDESSTV